MDELDLEIAKLLLNGPRPISVLMAELEADDDECRLILGTAIGNLVLRKELDWIPNPDDAEDPIIAIHN